MKAFVACNSMKTGHTEHLDPAALTAWFSDARPGAWTIYALGDLAFDRGPPGVLTLDAIAQRVWDWQHKGFVYLLQRRMPPHGFAYIVMRSASADRREVARERADHAMRLGDLVDAA
jgi:hypothetical protein